MFQLPIKLHRKLDIIYSGVHHYQRRHRELEEQFNHPVLLPQSCSHLGSKGHSRLQVNGWILTKTTRKILTILLVQEKFRGIWFVGQFKKFHRFGTVAKQAFPLDNKIEFRI